MSDIDDDENFNNNQNNSNDRDSLIIDPTTGLPAFTESISPHNDHNYCIKTKRHQPTTPPLPEPSPAHASTSLTLSAPQPSLDATASEPQSIASSVPSDLTSSRREQEKERSSSTVANAASASATTCDSDDLSELKNKFRIQLEHRLFEKSPSSSISKNLNSDSSKHFKIEFKF